MSRRSSARGSGATIEVLVVIALLAILVGTLLSLVAKHRLNSPTSLREEESQTPVTTPTRGASLPTPLSLPLSVTDIMPRQTTRPALNGGRGQDLPLFTLAARLRAGPVLHVSACGRSRGSFSIAPSGHPTQPATAAAK